MMLCLSNSIWHQLVMCEGSEHIEVNKCYFSNVMKIGDSTKITQKHKTRINLTQPKILVIL